MESGGTTRSGLRQLLKPLERLFRTLLITHALKKGGEMELIAGDHHAPLSGTMANG